MSLEIYAGPSAGQKTTALAAITAAIYGYIETVADGGKDLNREGLKAYLRAQFELMYPAYCSSLNFVLDLGANYLDAMIEPINAEFRRIRAAADHPVPIAPADAVAAVYRMQGEARRLSAELTTFYANTPREVGDVIAAYLRDNNIEAEIPDGVTRTIEDRVYLATFVTDRSEESAPSPISTMVELDQNDTCTVGMPAVPAGRFITHWRAYRSADGSAGADFELVPNPADEKGWPIATTSFTDSLKANELQEVCPTGLWLEPPADLRHIKAGPEGVNAGHTKNTWYCTVPFKPYAWLLGKGKTTDFPIVGHAAMDQGWLILTQGRPYLISGTDPFSMTSRKLDSTQACTSAEGIVEISGGAAYPSPDGICVADAAGNIQVVTEGLFKPEQWDALDPTSIRAVEHEGYYIFAYTGNGGGVYALHLKTGRLAKRDLTGSAFYRDLLTDSLFMATGTTVKRLYAGATKRTGIWRTKRADIGETGFAWLQVNGVLDAAVTVRIYAWDTVTKAMVLWDTAVLTDDVPVRVAEGTSDKWEIEVESATTSVVEVILASSVEELQQA
jgi:hypothetical protein